MKQSGPSPAQIKKMAALEQELREFNGSLQDGSFSQLPRGRQRRLVQSLRRRFAAQLKSLEPPRPGFPWPQALTAAAALLLTAGCPMDTTWYENDQNTETPADSDSETETTPVPGDSGALSFTDVRDISLTINWTAASDDATAPEDLIYTVYRSTSDNLNSLTECENNGESIHSTKDLTSYTDRSCQEQTTYYYNIIVTDAEENKAIYTSASADTGKTWSFAAPQQNPFDLTSSADPYRPHPTLVDTDNDGDLDLLMTANTCDLSDDVFRENTGTATPSFSTSSQGFLSFTTSYSKPNRPAAADLDNDGDTDILVQVFSQESSPYPYSNDFLVLKNEPAGTFADDQIFSTGLTHPSTAVSSVDSLLTSVGNVLADLDGDGDADLLSVFHPSSNPVFYYWENTGSASSPDFSSGHTTDPFGLTPGATPITSLAAADINNDGALDLVATTSNSIDFFLNGAAPGDPAVFGDRQSKDLGGSTLEQPLITSGDLDSDGDTDLLFRNTYINGSTLEGTDFYFLENTKIP